MPAKSVKKAITKPAVNKSKSEDKFPVSQVDYTQPLIVKNSKVSFGEKLVKVKGQHNDRLEDLIYEMDSLMRENKRLRMQQEDTFGISVGTIDRMKKTLEHSKATRAFLLEDIETRKEKSEKMEADIFELKLKLNSCTKMNDEHHHIKQERINISEELRKTEQKYQKLLKVQNNLKMLVSKHHIDSKSMQSNSERSKRSSKSDKGLPRPILNPKVEKHNIDAHNHKHNYMKITKTLSRSMGGSREITRDSNENIKRYSLISTKRVLGRSPQTYLGYYKDMHHNHKMMETEKFESLRLPRLVSA